MDTKKKFYVTTPIYYVTARPHIGTLYSTLLADVYARWHKLHGARVFFQTGTDEHGQKIAQAAEKAGMTPQQFVDDFVPHYKRCWHDYAIDYTNFMRTTDGYHVKAVQHWIETAKKRGDIYKGFYTGWYCVSDELFVAEKGTDDEKAPACPDCGRETVSMSEETYFFKLSAYQKKLLDFYEAHPDVIIPKERAREVISFLQRGLKDLSISRTTLKWGIPFPGDPEHVVYVWADALLNYISGVGYGQPGKEDELARWWPADLQILGKDIIRFHAIYWPAFLMAADLPLPKKLLVHGWITVDQQKMSKSLGNIVDPEQLYKRYGADAIRYYLLRHMSVTQDGDFSIQELEQRISSDLADDLGNLLNRMTRLAQKYDIYELAPPVLWSDHVIALRGKALDMLENVTMHMDDGMVHLALAAIWTYINQVNAFFHGQEPWKQAKKDPIAFVQTLSATAHSLRLIAYLLWPVMPNKMEQLLESLGVEWQKDKNENIFEQLTLGRWQQHFMLKEIPPLFEKPEIEVKQEKKTMEEPKKEESYITIDDVAKVELVVGTIQQAEALEGSDKLLKLQVDCGAYGQRQILAGVKKWYAPKDLEGMQGVFVVNLKPRKMMGIESQGVMLFAQAEDGKLTPATVGDAVAPGAKLR